MSQGKKKKKWKKAKITTRVLYRFMEVTAT